MDWWNPLYSALRYVNIYVSLRKLARLDTGRDEYQSHDTRWRKMFRIGGVRREDGLKIWVIVEKWYPWNAMTF